MESLRAALFVDDFNKEALLVFTLIIAVWAMARPAMIRDFDNRRLPPNLTARFIIVLLYALIYAGLVAAFVFARPFVMHALHALPDQVEGAFTSMEKEGPLLAVMALVGLHSLTPFREAERAFIIWIHSVRHLHGDSSTLVAHLQTCGFIPSDVEQQKNLDELARHNIFVTDPNSRDIDLPSVNTWRKLTTMLRCLREWNRGRRVLSDAQMGTLEELEKAHARKTRLAAEIIRLLNHVSSGKGTTEILTQLSALLASTSHSDRDAVVAVESRLKSLLAGGMAPQKADVRVSSKELHGFLSQIDGYFETEYQILLRQAAELIALSIVYAGDMAPERLGELKKVGFQGIGRIEPVSFDRILWLFLVISISGFTILYSTRYQQLRDVQGVNRPSLLLGLGIFSVTMAIAALIGAAFGSNKRYVHAQNTPWGAYFTASLVSVALFETGHAVRTLLTASEGAGSAPGGVPPLYQQLPWAVIPFLLTIGICWLARLNQWPTPRVMQPMLTAQAIWERCLDGALLAALIFVGYASAIELHEVLNITLPASLIVAPYDPRIFVPIMLFGFVIGAVAVRDSRRAGRATIVERPERRDFAFAIKGGVRQARVSWYRHSKSKDAERRTHIIPPGTTITIGRSPDLEIVLDDNGVSRTHARLEFTGEKIIFEDLGSSNGSLLNGTQRINRVDWQPGQHIRIGNHILEVELLRDQAGDTTLPLPPPQAYVARESAAHQAHAQASLEHGVSNGAILARPLPRKSDIA